MDTPPALLKNAPLLILTRGTDLDAMRLCFRAILRVNDAVYHNPDC